MSFATNLLKAVKCVFTQILIVLLPLQTIEPLLQTKDTPFTRVIKLNSPEWKSITAASLCSLISGFSMPLLTVVLGDFLGVSLNFM